HHAFEAKLHHVIEKGAHGSRVGAVEQSRVGRNPEASAESLLNSIDGDVVPTFAANGQIVLLALPVKVNAEGQIFAGLKEVNLLFQQQRVGAEIDIFLTR